MPVKHHTRTAVSRHWGAGRQYAHLAETVDHVPQRCVDDFAADNFTDQVSRHLCDTRHVELDAFRLCSLRLGSTVVKAVAARK